MAITPERIKQLEALCKTFRADLIELLHRRQTGHPGGSLSVCEILTAIYFYAAKVDPKNPKDPKRDRVILSKGHGAPMLYRILAEKGFFEIEQLQTLRKINSTLQGHPCAKSTPGVDLTSGPLGLGIAAANGIALGLKLEKNDATVFTIIGDGEIQEGIVWEAAMAASKFGIDNTVTILDYNRVQLDGFTKDIMPERDIKAKFEAFGYNVLLCDGHSIAELCNKIDEAKAHKNSPTIIVAKTIKGKGVSFMENKNIWHGKPINDQEYLQAKTELAQ